MEGEEESGKVAVSGKEFLNEEYKGGVLLEKRWKTTDEDVRFRLLDSVLI